MSQTPDSEKVAVVAGGTAGVGRAVAEMLLGRGYSVAVLARGEDRLETFEEAYPGRVLAIEADVAKHAEVDAAAEEVMAKWGRIDTWVNSAMLTAFSPFKEMGPDEFETIVDATFIGQVNGTRAALRHMERGNIVCIGSGLSYRSVPMQSAYCASKHAINGFAQSVRSELIRENSGVHISLVQLPAINTPQFDWAKNRLENKPQPAPPIYQPEVAARAVLKAIDENSREIFVGGSVLELVFGNFVMPWFLDRQLASSGVEMQQSEQSDYSREGNLDGPVDREGTAHGSYDGKARSSGLIVDADQTRGLAFVGIPLLAFAAGMLATAAMNRSGGSRIGTPAVHRPRR